MFTDRKEFDWETREDAELLQRYAAMRRDPERMRRARSCIESSINDGKAALGIPTPPPVPGRRNPATIMRLEPNRR